MAKDKVHHVQFSDHGMKSLVCEYKTTNKGIEIISHSEVKEYKKTVGSSYNKDSDILNSVFEELLRTGVFNLYR